MYKSIKFNPAVHHRKSIRLKGYDYSRPGLYFITICVQNRDCLFGEIVDAKMNLNDAGKMVEKWYFELENKFPDIKCHEMIVMPNHFHCIVQNTGAVTDVVVKNAYDDVSIDVPDNDHDAAGNDVPVGADLRVCPENDNKTDGHSDWGEHNLMDGHSDWGEHNLMDGHSDWGEHVGSPLQRVVQWLKTMTTNEYIRGVKNLGWRPFNGKLWQRNYYEHIIRNEKSFHAISEYITNNPAKWNDDQLFQ
jgi:putative transposase